MDTPTPTPDTPPQLASLKLDKSSLGNGYKSGLPRWIIVAGCLLALTGGGIALNRAYHVPEVKTQTVSLWYPSSALTVLTASGYVVPQRKAALASKATGRLQWLGVKEGDLVKAGQIIAKLDSQDVEATLKQSQAQRITQDSVIKNAQAHVDYLQRELKRTQSLAQEGFLSQSSLDNIRTQLKQAQAALEQTQKQAEVQVAATEVARINVDYTTIRSPFDGIVLTKQANVGDIVTPFSSAADSKGAVITIADLASLEIEADVNESSIGKIFPNQSCEVTLDAYPDQRFEGIVSHIVPTVDRSKATVMTKIKLVTTPPRLLPDMSAKVSFLKAKLPADRTPRLSLPKEALIGTEPSFTVWKINEQKTADKKPSTTLESIAIHLEEEPEKGIVTLRNHPRLKVGDTIVLNPDAGFKNGQTVKVAP